MFSTIDRLLDKKDLFKDALESPNRGDDSYNCDRFIESKYCSVKQAGIHFDQAKKQNGFSILHCNMRSLTKNLSLLQDILLTMRETPNVISETKLNENSKMNIDISGHTFLSTNSKSAAGGVGLYVSEELVFTRRYDLNLCQDGVESCWIELP